MVPFVNPTARAGRMRQRDRHRTAADMLNLVRLADQPVERLIQKKARDRQPSDRYQECRAHDSQLRVEPDGARFLFGWRRHAIAAATRAWAGVAARDRRNVDPRARRLFVDPGPFEPAKERFPRSTGEWFAPRGFDLTRRLSDEHRR